LSTNTENASQVDVYWTIQTVLHDLRSKQDLGKPYHTTLISPACFDRYNDGVIQACLLRAAKPIELNYTVDHDASRKMCDIITSIIKNWENEQGEASFEFLMAICSKRLSLIPEHLIQISSLSKDEMPEALKFLIRKVFPLVNSEPLKTPTP